MNRKNKGKSVALLSTSLAALLAVPDLSVGAVSPESLDVAGKRSSDASAKADKVSERIELTKKQDEETISSASPAKPRAQRVRRPPPPRRRPPASPAK